MSKATKQQKVRKEIHLTTGAVSILSKLAKKEGRTLKPYMEKVLNQHTEHEK
jgi:hypothetical protein